MSCLNVREALLLLDEASACVDTLSERPKPPLSLGPPSLTPTCSNAVDMVNAFPASVIAMRDITALSAARGRRASLIQKVGGAREGAVSMFAATYGLLFMVLLLACFPNLVYYAQASRSPLGRGSQTRWDKGWMIIPRGF